MGLFLMTTPYRIISSPPDRWTMPRPRSGKLPRDIHGPLLGMETERRGFWARVWGIG